jgi:CRISPR-associated protein Cas1
MPTLYVTRPGAVVRRAASALVVTADRETGGGATKRETLAELQPHRLEAIGIVGRSHMTTDATHLCLERGISVTWFTAGGRLKGRLVPPTSRTAETRLAQYALSANPDAALELSRAFISTKLRNGAAVLSVLRGNRPREPALGKAIRYLRKAADRAQRMDGKESLLGIEGDAAKTYFAALSHCFTGPIAFTSRVRRPPPDPANALLSFAYVLLANRVAGLLEARGLDAYVGFLHAVRSGRPSLGLDLIEELRHPVVDRFVLRVCNRRQLRPEHFQPDPRRAGGVNLNRDGLNRFFTAWEKLMRSELPGAPGHLTTEATLRLQVELLTAHLRHGHPYLPFTLPEKT